MVHLLRREYSGDECVAVDVLDGFGGEVVGEVGFLRVGDHEHFDLVVLGEEFFDEFLVSERYVEGVSGLGGAVGAEDEDALFGEEFHASSAGNLIISP